MRGVVVLGGLLGIVFSWVPPSSQAQDAALNLSVFKGESWGAHLRPILALAVSAEGLIATGSVDETGKLWAGIPGRLQKTIGAHGDSVTAVAFSPDGSLLFTGSDDQSVRLLETRTASERQVLRIQGRVRSLAASRTLLAVGTDNGRIQVFELRQGGAEATALLQGHSAEVRNLAFKPGSGVLLSGSRDGTVRLWDAAKGTSLASKSEGVPVSGVAFDPAGQRLAYALENGLVYLHPANAFSQNSAVRAPGGVLALALSPDGAYVALAVRGGGVQMLEVASRKLSPAWSDPRDVAALAFLPSGTGLVAAAGTQVFAWVAPTAVFRPGAVQAGPPEGQKGGVRITSTPSGATVLHEGKVLGNTPLTIEDLEPGSYRFTLRLQGYESREISVTVTAGRIQAVEARLTQVAAAQPQPGPPAAVSPTVALISPPNREIDSLEFSVVLRISNPAGVPLEIELVDASTGRTLTRLEARNVGVETTETRSYTFRLPPDTPPGIVQLTIVVTPRGGAPQTLYATVNYQPARPSQPQAALKRLRVLVVGINKYEDPNIRPLGLAEKDASDLARVFERQKGRAYDEVQVVRLLGKDALLPRVKSTLGEFRRNASDSDTTVLFFSGHGFNDGQVYLIPMYNSRLSDLESDSLRQSDVEDFVSKTRGRVMVFIDTCYSGAVVGGRSNNPDPDRFVQSLAAGSGDRLVMAASRGGQPALEKPDWGNGAFTKALLEALEGGAADASGVVTSSQLFAYVSRRVRELTQNQQIPQQRFVGEDFPVARVR